MKRAFVIIAAWLCLSICAAIARAAAPVPAVRDCIDCPELIVIPSGSFTMGVAPGEELRENLGSDFRGRSEPAHVVRVRGFLAGRFEVTRGQYRRFVEATGRSNDGCFVWGGDRYVLDGTKSWRDPGYLQEDTHPATCVSWEDATAYAAWLSALTGKTYRLLTEAEWEYVARAGSVASRPWGDDPSQSCAHANGADRSLAAVMPAARSWGVLQCDDGYAHTAPVGRYAANAFGVHDMLGNVWEWTQDCWNPGYAGAPADGSAWSTGDCGMRAVRGGSWDDVPAGLRAAYRVGSPVIIRVYGRGFRIARDE